LVGTDFSIVYAPADFVKRDKAEIAQKSLHGAISACCFIF
jgi:hypothetical protein